MRTVPVPVPGGGYLACQHAAAPRLDGCTAARQLGIECRQRPSWQLKPAACSARSVAVSAAVAGFLRGQSWWRARQPPRRFSWRRAARVTELLPATAEWPELVAPDGLETVALEGEDVDAAMELLAEVFPAADAETRKALADRLGARRSLVGDGSALRSLRRPVPLGSTERPESGLVLAYVPSGGGNPVAMVDISLWPNDSRVRAPGARSKAGVPSLPYMLNLCVSKGQRRRGLARQLLLATERIISDCWGDSGIYLHVEDDEEAANALYEVTGYEGLDYEYDAEFPHTKSEAAVLRKVTWRYKPLTPPAVLIGVETAEVADTDRDGLDEDDAADNYSSSGSALPTEGKEEDQLEEEEEDFSWVTALVK